MNVDEDGGVGLSSVPRVHASRSPYATLGVPWLLSRERLLRLKVSCRSFEVDLNAAVVDGLDVDVLKHELATIEDVRRESCWPEFWCRTMANGEALLSGAVGGGCRPSACAGPLSSNAASRSTRRGEVVGT